MAAQDNDIKNKRPDALMVDELGDLSEEDIERMLQNSSDTSQKNTEEENSEQNSSADNESGGDVLMDLLEQSDDAELNDIHSMLQKSDKNEPIDKSIEEMINQSNNPEDMTPDLEAKEALEMVMEMTDPKDRKKNAAAQKRRLKQEKKKEAERLKAEKRKEKEAKKAKKSGKKSVDDIDVQQLEDDDKMPEIPAIGDSQVRQKRELAYDENMVIPQLNETDDLESKEFDNIVSGLDEVDISDTTNLFEGQEVSTDQLVEQEIERYNEAAAKENGEEAGENGKKKGFFARLIQLLTQSPDDEEEETSDEMKLSDENEVILKEMDEGKKGKKKKEKGKKKDKKAEAGGEEGAEGGEGGDGKKGKKEKKKKPKKEKAPKLESAEKNSKKLPKKGIIMIFAFCISLAAVVFLINLFVSDYAVKKAAKNAFEAEDYKTCYQNLYGKKRNDTEDVMFHKSECIIKIQIWIKEYEMQMNDGKRLEALDRLIQAVCQYPELYVACVKWNAVPLVSDYYQDILGKLDSNFHISELQALEIGAIPNNVEYTKTLKKILADGGYKGESGSIKAPDKDADAKDSKNGEDKDGNTGEAKDGTNPDNGPDGLAHGTGDNPDAAGTDGSTEGERSEEILVPVTVEDQEEKWIPIDAQN